MKKLKTDQEYQKILPLMKPKGYIPKIIFQTYKTKDIKDDIICKNIVHLKEINPGYQYKLFDDDDIIDFIKENYNTVILNYFNRISPNYGAAKADLFRYLLIYAKGGIYLDIKSSVTKPFDESILYGDKLILSHWDNEEGRQHENWGYYREIQHINQGEYQQWHIIADSGHPIIREVIIQVLKNIDNYNPYKDGVGLMGTLKTTGPIVYSNIVHNMIQKRYTLDYRIVDGVNDIGLLYSIYEAEGGCFFHKIALKIDYNRLSVPIIQGSCKQGLLYKIFFECFYFRWQNFVRKWMTLRRERKKHKNFLSFFCFLFRNKTH